MSESTELIDRANRLMSLRTNPGFSDLFQISKHLVESLTSTAIEYPGWDIQQLMVLKARAQAAKEHHELLFGTIKDAIEAGIRAQAASPDLHSKTIAEVIEQGDYVRQAVLTKFEEMESDNRAAGSYAPANS